MWHLRSISSNLSLLHSTDHLFWCTCSFYLHPSFSQFPHLARAPFPTVLVACPGSKKRHLRTPPKTQWLPLLKHSAFSFAGEKGAWWDAFQSLHIHKTTAQFHFGNTPCHRCILKKKKGSKYRLGFFLALWKFFSKQNSCCCLESCRNQCSIWYHTNMVISVTKTGLLWNLNAIYDKTIVLTFGYTADFQQLLLSPT